MSQVSKPKTMPAYVNLWHTKALLLREGFFIDPSVRQMSDDVAAAIVRVCKVTDYRAFDVFACLNNGSKWAEWHGYAWGYVPTEDKDIAATVSKGTGRPAARVTRKGRSI